MRNLYEFIDVKKAKLGYELEDKIREIATDAKEDYIVYFEDFTFEEFIKYASEDVWEKCLKKAFSDSTKQFTNGRITFVFKDGNYGIEIITLTAISGKMWREAWIPKNEIKQRFVTIYNYTEYFEKLIDKEILFTTPSKARLKNIIGDYIEHLKKVYPILIK